MTSRTEPRGFPTNGSRATRLLAAAWLLLALSACDRGDPVEGIVALHEEGVALATRLADRPSEAADALEDFVDAHRGELAGHRDALVALAARDPDAGDAAMRRLGARRDPIFARWSALLASHPALAHEPRLLRAMRRLLL